jgi:hypothetical protein
MSYAVDDQLMIRAVLNEREKVTLVWLPLAVLCSTGVPSFQLTSTLERFPSTSPALKVSEYVWPVATLAPLDPVRASVGT